MHSFSRSTVSRTRARTHTHTRTHAHLPTHTHRYFEVRLAPQLHCNDKLDIDTVLHAVNNGLKKAKDEFNEDPGVQSGEDPPFEYGYVSCVLGVQLVSTICTSAGQRCSLLCLFRQCLRSAVQRCHPRPPVKNTAARALRYPVQRS